MYVVSRFPKGTETFIARELNAVARSIDVVLATLVRPRSEPVQPEAAPWLDGLLAADRAGPRALAAAHLHWLVRRPRRLLAAWWEALWGNRSSPRMLVRAVAVVVAAAWFAREAERRRVVHVHAHWATHPALAALVIHRLCGLPYTVTGHAHDIYARTTMLCPKLRAARAVVTISEFNRRHLAQRCPEVADRITVVHCGIEPDRYAQAARARAAAEGDGMTVRLICVAALRPFKGHAVLLDAVARVVADGADVHLDVVGDGPEAGALRRRATGLGIADRVRWWGHVPSDRIPGILAEADIAVLASVVAPDGRTDGIPVALMEAMAAGLPAVASDVTGVSELVIDGVTGLLVPPGDPDALARAIGRLAADPDLRRRLGTAAREHVLAGFTVEASARRLVDLFTSGLPTAGEER